MDSILKQQKPFLKDLQEHILLFENSQELKQALPKQIINKDDLNIFTQNLNYTNQHDLNSLQKTIIDPIQDLLARGGKRIRAIFCIYIAQAFNMPIQKVMPVSVFCELLHNGTLIVDDIEDQSSTRRNDKAIHLKYGLDIAINAGTFLYFAPLHYLLQQKQYSDQQKYQMSLVAVEEMTVAHIGQAWDISWHNQKRLNIGIPTQDQYLQMCAHKTGILQRLAAKISCIALKLDEEIKIKLSNFAEKLGIAFQIQDDILNLIGNDYQKTKGQLGEDIHEGKFSILTIHALNTLDENSSQELLSILQSKTNDQNLIDQAIQLIKNADSFKYAEKVCLEIVQDAWNSIKDIVPEGEGKEKLKYLAQFVIKRSF